MNEYELNEMKKSLERLEKPKPKPKQNPHTQSRAFNLFPTSFDYYEAAKGSDSGALLRDVGSEPVYIWEDGKLQDNSEVEKLTLQELNKRKNDFSDAKKLWGQQQRETNEIVKDERKKYL
jgi:hypothetical protein